MRSFVWAPAVAGLSLVAVAGCDFDQLSAEKVMVATLLATPPTSISATSAAGLDAGFDGGEVTVPGQTVATVFFGQRDNSALDEPPSPVEGATISVGAAGGTAVTLDDLGDGNYALTSAENSNLTYASGAHVQFVARYRGETYTASVVDTPQVERIAALHPAQGWVDHTAGAPFSFTRPDPPAGQERNLGFVTVYPVSDQGQKGQPTWSNVPTMPLDFLKLVVRPSQWKTSTVTVPGTAFPDPSSTYVLVVQAVKSGGPETENLFTGSAILAGTAELGVFRTR